MKQPYDKSKFPRGFWPYVFAQFQGALSDTIFRLFVVFTLVRAGDATGSSEASGSISAIGMLLFAVPFFLFPAQFGAISDRFPKQVVAVWMKYIEVGIMLLAGIALYTANPILLYGTLFLTAIHSAQFQPFMG
jgi:hypothetical protein